MVLSPQISWITPRLGIADGHSGILAAQDASIKVVNVAQEVTNPNASITSLISAGTVDMFQLDFLSNWINWWLKTQEGRIVIHCLLGEDRSPLVLAWYFHRHRNLSLDEAYEKIKEIRPQVNDRRNWLIPGIQKVINDIKNNHEEIKKNE